VEDALFHGTCHGEDVTALPRFDPSRRNWTDWIASPWASVVVAATVMVLVTVALESGEVIETVIGEVFTVMVVVAVVAPFAFVAVSV
jgi:hypothetical protein